MSDSEGDPLKEGAPRIMPGLSNFRFRIGSEGSTAGDAAQRGAKRVATSPPQMSDLYMEPPPLSDQELSEMKDVLSTHDYNFSAINVVSKETVDKKRHLVEAICAYRNAVDKLTSAYCQLKAERDITTKIWKMMRSMAGDNTGQSDGLAETIRESVGDAVSKALDEKRSAEAERSELLVASIAENVGVHVEKGIKQAMVSMVGPMAAGAGRSYAGVVGTSGVVPGLQGPKEFGRKDDSRGRLETIEVCPGIGIGDKIVDSQATCDAVLTSIKPSESGIKIDRVIKGQNKVVRIVAEKEDLNKLRPMLGSIGMEVKQLDRLNPRLLIRDIPAETDKQQFVENLVKQNLDKTNVADVKLVYWSSVKAQKSVNAVIEVSSSTRSELLKRGRVYLGWSSCRVSDHLRITQCYKCLGFGHLSTKCQAAADVCGHCSGSHESRKCPNRTGLRKCHNCATAGLSIVDHSALDAQSCPMLQRRLADRAKRIQY